MPMRLQKKLKETTRHRVVFCPPHCKQLAFLRLALYTQGCIFLCFFMRYPILLFDYDGTIASSLQSIENKVRHTCQKFDLPVPSNTRLLTYLYSGEPVLPQIVSDNPSLQNLPKHTYQQWLDYYDQLSGRPALYPQIQEIIPTLAKNRTLHIVSNHYIQATKRNLETDGLAQYFTSIHGPTPPSIRFKPHPDMFDVVKSFYPNAKNEDFLMVGDTIADIAFAKHCGIDIAWARYGLGNVRDIAKHHMVNHTLSTPNDLLTLLGVV